MVGRATCTIELFINSVPNPTGYGEGERFFASLTVATDAAGNASFNLLSLPIEVDPGQFVSATATDPAGNTSQFALSVAVTGPGLPLPSLVPPLEGQGRIAGSLVPLAVPVPHDAGLAKLMLLGNVYEPLLRQETWVDNPSLLPHSGPVSNEWLLNASVWIVLEAFA